MKTTVILMLLGALLGVAIAALAVPPSLAWYTSPGGLPQGGSVQSLVQIPEVIRYATGKLIMWQEIAGGIGAVAGLVIGVMLGRSRSHRIQDERANPHLK